MKNDNLDVSMFNSLDEVQIDDKLPQFSRLPAYIVCDTNLTGNAKAIMAYVFLRKDIVVKEAGKTRKWGFVKQDIINNMNEGPTAVTTAFNNLIERGYLVQSKLFKDPKKGNSRRIYKFFTDPAENKFYKGELPQNDFYKKLKEKAPSDTTPKKQKKQTNKHNKTYNNSIPPKNKNRSKTRKNNDTVGDFDLSRFD